MEKFLNNEPMFKVGDKVVYSRRRDDMADWEKESIDKGPLTILNIDRFYRNDELIDVYYFVEGLDYVYSENWLSYASVEEQLVRDLEICGGVCGCTGCSRENPDGTGTGCDKLELDAAELIKKLQKRVKELEEKK